MKKKITVVLVGIVISLLMVSIYLHLQDPLQGKWLSDKGDGYGLVQAKGAPFIFEFKKNSFFYNNKEYKILQKTVNEDGRIFLKSDELTLKLRFKTHDEIIFSFPKIGIRRYKRVKS